MGSLNSGEHGFTEILQAAKKPMIILGQGALRRPDGAAVLAAAWALGVKFNMLNAEWHGFNILHTAAARVGGARSWFSPRIEREKSGRYAEWRGGCALAAGRR